MQTSRFSLGACFRPCGAPAWGLGFSSYCPWPLHHFLLLTVARGSIEAPSLSPSFSHPREQPEGLEEGGWEGAISELEQNVHAPCQLPHSCRALC